jgi:hypothetical protein
MQAVIGWVNVAVCKQETDGKTVTACRLRDQGDIEKLIQQHNGYQILKQLCCLLPSWKLAQKDLMAMM